MPVLYLVEQGATLRKQGDTLVVTKNDSELQVIPAAKVEQVVLFGNINITTPAIHYLLSEGKDCVFCSQTGKYHGRLFSTESKFGLLRLSQFRAVEDQKLSLRISTQIIAGKLSNQEVFLKRAYRRNEEKMVLDAAERIKELRARAESVDSLGSLRGIEGMAASIYFAAFRLLLKQDLGFKERARRPPRDPINSLLSFGYTLLVYDAQAAIRVVGLDPFLGFFHSTEYSKPSLALDLMEEFRNLIVDSVVLSTVNNFVLKKEDFLEGIDTDGMVRLKDNALKIFIRDYEDKMLSEVLHPVFDIKVTYRRAVELQARQIARIVSGNQEKYQPFITR
jgi:CRISPR-associated protein Cas1